VDAIVLTMTSSSAHKDFKALRVPLAPKVLRVSKDHEALKVFKV
jgi:hypothetical protein